VLRYRGKADDERKGEGGRREGEEEEGEEGEKSEEEDGMEP